MLVLPVIHYRPTMDPVDAAATYITNRRATLPADDHTVRSYVHRHLRRLLSMLAELGDEYALVTMNMHNWKSNSTVFMASPLGRLLADEARIRSRYQRAIDAVEPQVNSTSESDVDETI
jgi:hypothetical protein